MNLIRLIALTGIAFAPVAAAVATGTAAAPGYAVSTSIAGPDGGWDYAVVDPSTHRLLLARESGVAALDLETNSWTAVFVPGHGVHGVAAAGNSGRMLSTNGHSDSATIFDAKSGNVLGTVKTGKDPDAAAYEPKTGLVVVMNGKSGDATLVDAAKLAAVGTVRVGGKLEFAVADGAGRVYVNVENLHQIAVIDVAAKKVLRRIRLTGCEEPTGLAYEPVHGILVSACGNGVAKAVDAASGKILATIPIGEGADAVILDVAHKAALVPSGRSGTLTVIDLADPAAIKAAGTVATHKGARTGAIDPGSGKIYLPAANFGPPTPPNPWPTVVPGSFAVVVVAPQ